MLKKRGKKTHPNVFKRIFVDIGACKHFHTHMLILNNKSYCPNITTSTKTRDVLNKNISEVVFFRLRHFSNECTLRIYVRCNMQDVICKM